MICVYVWHRACRYSASCQIFLGSLRNESMISTRGAIMTNDQKKSIRVVLLVTIVMMGFNIISLISNHGETVTAEIKSQVNLWPG